jgi:hypothetical protein
MPSQFVRCRALPLFLLLTLAVLGGCRKDPAATSPPQSGGTEYGSLARVDFNRRAVELFLPLFWREDANGNGALDVNELAVLVGYPRDERAVWVDTGRFTAEFDRAYQQMLGTDAQPVDPAEQQRRKLVLDELQQGRPTLVLTDLQNASPADRNLVQRMLNVAQAVERIYARQNGVFGMQDSIKDPASRMLFHRNQSPYCEAPRTEGASACSALEVKPPRIVGLYPAEVQSDPKFCDTLSKAPNAAEIMGHFTVVVNGEKQGTYRTVPYTEAYREDMEIIAKELEQAAAGLGSDEAALSVYLRAAANSFRSNDWEPANSAWVAMGAQNSRWYVRIAPDEVYYDPCAWKAGFALQFARINPESLDWQRRLDPVKRDMENTVAELAGKPYKAREVNFKIPDFIDVVLNAGDQRSASGATVGQSLPNWGPVAESGGRTVAMTNLYTDADSRNQQTQLMSSVFCKATNAQATTTPREALIGSLLHEAAHNLGPSHEYKVKGKVDNELFGGTLASTLEELKAQTTALYLTDWLGGKGMFTSDEVQKIHLRNIAWAFGHISRGMYAADGAPRNYSQLAAMQIGSLMKAEAISWRADELAANGQDRGCVEVDSAALAPAIKSLETLVLEIKASGDKARAEKLKAQFVDAKDDFAKVKDIIAERWLRAPRATFVYSLTM